LKLVKSRAAKTSPTPPGSEESNGQFDFRAPRST